uniref:Uncharacterized protein n=1 Tax=Picea glauca TaxID=3330 RepID=A0A101M5G5_PICGL|nr:hypothetical protein ABT39_MTgene1294 [Picea glauca]QHR87245.1 hypothetical protein Q903MT_gene1254 [Picea sitchensis]
MHAQPKLLLKRSTPNSQGRRLSLWLNPYVLAHAHATYLASLQGTSLIPLYPRRNNGLGHFESLKQLIMPSY